jgi:hypothetical protein
LPILLLCVFGGNTLLLRFLKLFCKS